MMPELDSLESNAKSTSVKIMNQGLDKLKKEIEGLMNKQFNEVKCLLDVEGMVDHNMGQEKVQDGIGIYKNFNNWIQANDSAIKNRLDLLDDRLFEVS